MSSTDPEATKAQAKVPDGLLWPAETGIWATYDMHCHCGAIKWTTTLSPPLLESQSEGKGVYTAVMCNCSHCERNSIIGVHPKAKNVRFSQGLDDRVEYWSGQKKNPHWFCRKCGSNVGADITAVMQMTGDEPRYLINLRMLKDVPLEDLQTKHVSFMKDMPPKYEV